MQLATRRPGIMLAVLSVAAVAGFAGFVWSGAYDVGADSPHTRPVHALLQTIRGRSIETRASRLSVPDLSDPARIAQGAGNYDAMCVGCHLAPGTRDTELSRGLYPAPPNLSQSPVDARAAFWAIKHGIKASGMPAWGRSMEDDYIWGMVAFLQKLPALDAAEYRALVASSSGHSHGGGESAMHPHAEGSVPDHHDDEMQRDAKPFVQQHADGPVESHRASSTDDGREHEH